MNFKKLNTLFGWLIFAIALIVYMLTLEPTLSLWDCGEFLVSAYKLEINHSPGNPFFMLLGRVFSLFSFGKSEYAAYAINMVSAVSSAATIMFLFWTISWLIQKIPNRQFPEYLVLFASAIGALSFAFTDSFWFSAVEAEVYALSSLFNAVVLWAATKWDREADEPYAYRWIVFIFLIIGLSIGVHLLNLLVIPTAALIFYFRKYKYTFKGFATTILVSGLGILFLMKIFIPGILNLSKGLELVFVNELQLPVNSGLLTYIVIIIVVLAFCLYYSFKKRMVKLNLVLLCILFLMIGYSSYVSTIIRSSANPPVDQGNPENTYDLLFYLNREQYGTRPILYGPTYGSVITDVFEQKTHKLVDGEYIESTKNPKLKYDSKTTGLFPRMHSRDQNHMKAYKNWVNIDGRKVNSIDLHGELVETIVPTFSENFSFFLNYQLGHMFMRYFMWNFVGRQNDIQNLGELTNGNWLSGVKFIDELRLGSQEMLPDELASNKGRNTYYFLPLILGLIGLVFHYKADMEQFFGMLLLFLIMSIGLVIYLNEIPITPRERDYVYVGAFYVFCIWMGIGILSVFTMFEKIVKKKYAIISALFVGLLAGPIVLIAENYDDHDRSGRYTARDLARNYLESCEKDAILFTSADNDTYPLWYCQEVEGVRKDVRIVVTPYLSAGWYIEQLRQKIYENNPLDFSIPLRKYQSGQMDYLYVVPKSKNEHLLDDVMNFVASDSSKTKLGKRQSEMIDFIPVNKIAVNKKNTNDTIHVQISKRALPLGDIAFWDIIANNWGKRPICFTSWTGPSRQGLENYLRFDGMVYTLTTDFAESENALSMGNIDSEITYNNLMNKCNWSNLQDNSVYFDFHHRRMLASMQVRNSFYKLANELVQEGDYKKASQVLDKSRQIVPFKHWKLNNPAILMSALYFEMGKDDEGLAYANELVENIKQWLNYYISLDPYYISLVFDDFRYKLYLYQNLIVTLKDKAPEEYLNQLQSDFSSYAELLTE